MCVKKKIIGEFKLCLHVHGLLLHFIIPNTNFTIIVKNYVGPELATAESAHKASITLVVREDNRLTMTSY